MSVSLIIFTFINVWWLSLFVVLPFGVKREESPEPGHSTGAPKNPRLKQKAMATSLLAAIITAAIYFYVGDANAAPYVAGENKCAHAVAAKPSNDVEYKPEAGQDVSPVNTDRVEIQLELPVTNYTATANPNLSESEIHLGIVAVEKSNVYLNNSPLTGTGNDSQSLVNCAQ